MLLDKRISILDFLRHIKYDIMAICIYAVVVGVLDEYSFLADLTVPIAVTTAVGTAVSLLLGFRTAQAYERWWEARIVWGAIVNDSRSLLRQCRQFIKPSPGSSQVIKQFAYQQIIWCHALTESLRKVPFSPKVKDFLTQNNIDEQNIPNAILNKQGDLLASADITEFRQVQIDETLTRLCESMGRCERIKNTVFPKSYSLLVHFIIYVFATLLPFGLDDNHIAIQIFLTALMPLIFISIERTAILMQDPFENLPMDTPMTSISTTIEINLKEFIDDENLPQKVKAEDYYIM